MQRSKGTKVAPGCSTTRASLETSSARLLCGRITPTGIQDIQPPKPTACIRPASLVYRAPTALNGVASRHLRHILRNSPARPRSTEPLPVSFVSLRGRQPDDAPKPLFKGDAILNQFLLNNGGYLDDSGSESENEVESPACRYKTSHPELATPPNTLTKKSSKALHPAPTRKNERRSLGSSVYTINRNR